MNMLEKSALEPLLARRGSNKVRRLHHFAIGTKDMAKTRAFYEDIVGLPHVATWKEEFPDPALGARRYMHCFFELGDGSAIAFFQFATGERRDPERLPREVFDHHIALAVGGIDDVLEMRERLKAANLPSALVDHGYCYSLYTRDPNGLLVEFAADPKIAADIMDKKAETAREELESWLAGDLSVSNVLRHFDASSLPTSSLEEIGQIAIPPSAS
jgi:catechol 2,3-dioxygenase-like lactoylglutathione lyase family enzyme